MPGITRPDRREAHRLLPGLLACLLVGTGCTDPSVGGTGGADSDEPPFFTANRNATGPLTLAELQIDIPDDIESFMSDAQRACFLEAVERRATEAGDPADLDPDDFVYWGGKVNREQWRKHDPYMQRVLLAQGIVSWAMMDC
jgi:hypothetical protein